MQAYFYPYDAQPNHCDAALRAFAQQKHPTHAIFSNDDGKHLQHPAQSPAARRLLSSPQVQFQLRERHHGYAVTLQPTHPTRLGGHRQSQRPIPPYCFPNCQASYQQTDPPVRDDYAPAWHVHNLETFSHVAATGPMHNGQETYGARMHHQQTAYPSSV